MIFRGSASCRYCSVFSRSIQFSDRNSVPAGVACAFLFTAPETVWAFAGESFLLGVEVPLIWVVLSGVVALGALFGLVVMRARVRTVEHASATQVADLQVENAKLFRQLQTRVHELIARDKQLDEFRASKEQLVEEHLDFLSITGHRLHKPLETLVSTMNLLVRGTEGEVRQLAEAAQGQCRLLRSSIEDIQRAAQATPAAPGSAIADELQKLEILLIENDSHPTLRTRLEAHGHRVRRETNGVDGAEAALQGNFDLVLVDVRLPLIDGLETARKIRGDQANESLLIFGMVDKPSEGDRERYMARGLSGILPLPASDVHLLQLLGWVDEKNRSEESKGKPARVAKLLNASTLERQRDTLGHLAFAELLGDRLANLPKKITAFTSALTGRHWLDAQHQAQAIAGQAESVGLELVASRLRALSARLSIDSERDYCRHQRTEILTLMRNSIVQLKAWREKNVHTQWALS